jgi:transposase-like protein
MFPNSKSGGTASLAKSADHGVDEIYVKIKGRWTYLYCAVDKAGNTIDFLLRAKRDVISSVGRRGARPLRLV